MLLGSFDSRGLAQSRPSVALCRADSKAMQDRSSAPPGRPSGLRSGLSETEAARRLAAEGPNELPTDRARSLLEITRSVLAEPMFLLLLGAVAVYLLLGDAAEAIVLGCSLLAVVGITVYQERRTARVLRALRDLSSPRALVIRDGGQRRIPGREVVRGDVLVVREGDRVPADAVLRECVGIAVDESLLTGESVPVTKSEEAEQVTVGRPGGEGLPFLYSGTMVVRGHGIAEVLATGPATQIGLIGTRLATVQEELSPLQRETRRIVRVLAVAGLTLCALVIALLTATRGSLLDAVLAGITLAMTVLPEEFPVVLTVFLALGAWRMASQGVLTRRTPAIEALGATTVLAVDKTGTLTENRMQVQVLEAGRARADLRDAAPVMDAPLRALLGIAFGACERDVVDPMERAIVNAASTLAPEATDPFSAMTLVREYDVSADLLAVVHVWKRPEGDSCQVTAKGAPEAIASLCRLDAAAAAELRKRAEVHAREGMRVLAVARGLAEAASLPDAATGIRLEFCGLMGLADPVRRDVPGAIAECHGAGIRVVMITGDYAETALAVARAIGLDIRGGAISGPEIELLDDAALAQRARAVNVYARMVPEQKLRLVQALKADGAIVAMTGDGVNDAPALKAAHIGVAMGGRGTDVAREAASLVLLEDDFATLVATMRAGRRIYDNIRNAMSYLLAVHVPLAGMGLLPALTGWPLFFFPVHVVFLEFIIDPACSLVFEAERGPSDLMRRPPRRPGAPLFSRGMLAFAALLGVATLAAAAGIYGSLLGTHGEQVARASAFVTIVTANIVLIMVSRSRRETALTVALRPNPVFLAIAAAACAALALVLYYPPAARLFRFAPLDAGSLGLALGLGVASVLWYDLVKLVPQRRSRGGQQA
jgi:Ca2+-transporting ATPase